MLELDGIDVYIGDNKVLRNVSLEVKGGRRAAVIGANGAGKSTMIRTIFGLIAPKKGRVILDGREIQGRKCHDIARRGVSCAPEGRRIFTDMSVLDNLRMGAYVASARNRLPQTLDKVTGLFPVLADRLHQRAGTLSGGEQQMLSIGRALMSLPKLLLIDELSLGLAPLVVLEIYRALENLGEEITILLVEQNVEQALKHSRNAYVLETGRVVKSGPSEELLADSAIREAYLGL